MEREIVTKRIGEILDEISRLSNVLFAMNTTDIQKYTDNYEILSTDAALRGEKIACRLRRLIYISTGIKKSEYLNAAGTIHGIKIEYLNGIMEITIPCLLPKRKQSQGTEFLLDPFFHTLSNYAENNILPKFTHCVVCFSHVYALPKRRIRDYDNLELKQILDIISTYLMVDDTGLLCDAYNTTELGKIDCTRISIMNKDNFPNWLIEKRNQLETIKDFGS